MLEKENLPVGIVTAIAGVTRATVEIDGVAGHAGTVPMPMRKDALHWLPPKCCSRSNRARRGAAQSGSDRRQIGRAGIGPNTIPGRVRFTLDIRSASDPEQIDATADIRQSLDAIARRRGVSARASGRP